MFGRGRWFPEPLAAPGGVPPPEAWDARATKRFPPKPPAISSGVPFCQPSQRLNSQGGKEPQRDSAISKTREATGVEEVFQGGRRPGNR
jgi:hypothetical protein